MARLITFGTLMKSTFPVKDIVDISFLDAAVRALRTDGDRVAGTPVRVSGKNGRRPRRRRLPQ